MIDVQKLRKRLAEYHATETEDPASAVMLARYAAVALPALLDVYEAACAWVDNDSCDRCEEECVLMDAIDDARMT